jgi:hypothetical protein
MTVTSVIAVIFHLQPHSHARACAWAPDNFVFGTEGVVCGWK